MKIEGLLKEVSRHSLVWCCREAVLKEMTPELALEGRIGTSRVKDKKEVPGRLAGVKVLGYEKALPASATISSSYGCLGNKDGKGGSHVLGKPAGPGLVVRHISQRTGKGLSHPLGAGSTRQIS